MELYLFNPDTDLALADNGHNYMPSTLVTRMAEDLALLPLWYAPADGGVLLSSVRNQEFVDAMHAFFPQQARPVQMSELASHCDVKFMPWGWNRTLRRKLLLEGVREESLPDLSWLDAYRRCASRLTALEVLREMQHLPNCLGKGESLATVAACERFLRRYGDCVFKALWSGSGKGLRWCREGNFPPDTANWCARMQREQGAVVAMPIYNKVRDFAMEFYVSAQGETSFVGYSLFTTNAKGAYMDNLLDADERLEEYLTVFVSAETLRRVREHLRASLTARFGGVYTGYVGVDMMICRRSEEQTYGLFPCVEINLRMNMGVVAHEFYRRFVHPGSTGVFHVEYHRSTEDLLTKHHYSTQTSPAVVRGGRLLSGYMPLVPVTAVSRYRVYVEVEPAVVP